MTIQANPEEPMRALTAAGINSPAAIAVGVAVTMVFGPLPAKGSGR